MAKKKRPSKPSPKPAPAKRKPGRPPDTGYKPTDLHRKQVEMGAAIGIPHDDLVLLLINPTSHKPISPKTLRKVFAEELRTGTVKAKMQAGGNLLALTKTSAGAAIFYAKTRLGMKEEFHHKHSGKVQSAPILSDEQMERRIQQLLDKGKGPQHGRRQPRRDRGKP